MLKMVIFEVKWGQKRSKTFLNISGWVMIYTKLRKIHISSPKKEAFGEVSLFQQLKIDQNVGNHFCSAFDEQGTLYGIICSSKVEPNPEKYMNEIKRDFLFLRVFLSWFRRETKICFLSNFLFLIEIRTKIGNLISTIFGQKRT